MKLPFKVQGGDMMERWSFFMLAARTHFILLKQNMTCNKLTMGKVDLVTLLCRTIHPSKASGRSI